MNFHRGTLDMVVDVMQATERTNVKTRIMYLSNTTSKRLNSILIMLETRNLIRTDKTSERTRIYLTLEGHELLHTLTDIYDRMGLKTYFTRLIMPV